MLASCLQVESILETMTYGERFHFPCFTLMVGLALSIIKGNSRNHVVNQAHPQDLITPIKGHAGDAYIL